MNNNCGISWFDLHLRRKAAHLESIQKEMKRVSRASDKTASIWSLLERQGFTLDGLVFPPTSKKRCFVQFCVVENANPVSIRSVVCQM